MMIDKERNMSGKFILIGHETAACGNLIAWSEWFEKADRTVAKTKIGEIEVSTVFLGLDHSFSDNGPPLLFETMVFKGPLDGEQERCSTWEQAKVQHAAMLERVSHEPSKLRSVSSIGAVREAIMP